MENPDGYATNSNKESIMSTRGTIGFRLDGKDKLMYNHSDSYPECLGISILEECRTLLTDKEEVKQIVKSIELVENDSTPTVEQIKSNRGFTDVSVGTQSVKDWYCLLRDTQGTIQPYIMGQTKHMLNGNNFIKDSLFCEWGYIINLDTNQLEVWQGFQKVDNTDRYGGTSESQYYACKLIKEYDLDKLPTKEEFLKDLKVEDSD